MLDEGGNENNWSETFTKCVAGWCGLISRHRHVLCVCVWVGGWVGGGGGGGVFVIGVCVLSHKHRSVNLMRLCG